MSLALYRTYRPARLADVVGQEHITTPLARALDNDRVHHAYLFSGPRGCGKTSTARIMARSLNCEQGPTSEPCGACQSCVDLAAGGPGSIDVIELDAASHGGVDDTRDLRERAMFAPASSRYKIYIIDEAHMVSTAGFNALLKLVEEPPEHVRFIFATTDPDKVLTTIRSRTHNYAFRLVGTKDLQQLLASICEAEGVSAEPSALALVARAGAGSVRDSLSILGQVIAGSGTDGVTYAEVAGQLGVTESAVLDATIEAIANRDGAALFDVVEGVVDSGHEPRRFVSDLLERMRDVIVVQSVPDAVQRGLLDTPDDEARQIVAQAELLGPAEASRAADVISRSLGELKGATAPRLRLEIMAARLLVPAAENSDVGALARIEHLERALASGVRGAEATATSETTTEATTETTTEATTPRKSKAATKTLAAPPPPKISEVAPSTAIDADDEADEIDAKAGPDSADSADSSGTSGAPAPDAESAMTTSTTTAADSDITLEGFVTMWPAVMDTLSRTRVAWMLFNDSRPVSWSDGVLAVAVDSPGKVANAASSGHDEKLRAAIADTLKVDLQIDVVVASTANASASGNGGGSSSTKDLADAPSVDDVNVDDISGVDLVMREMGATQIGEIEH
ncbi:MAG: DNA polymerase III subunit gamma and tau [Candidatus Nanopelagicales bacterium]|nr:DNA polymerase III subunit gamma and tau [Candidatus Nanopelagicales bacterium]